MTQRITYICVKMWNGLGTKLLIELTNHTDFTLETMQAVFDVAKVTGGALGWVQVPNHQIQQFVDERWRCATRT